MESSEFDHILAKEDEARFDFNAALNSSIKQERIYSDLSTVLYKRMISISRSVQSFNSFRAETWCIALTMILTIGNTCLIILLSMRIKGLQLALISLKPINADFIYNQAKTTTAPGDTKEFWVAFQQTLSEMWETENLLILILLLLSLIFIMAACKMTIKRPKYQTYMCLDLQNANYRLEKIVCYLPYTLKHYKIDIFYAEVRLENYLFFSIIRLYDCIKISEKITELHVPVTKVIYLAPWQIKSIGNLLTNDHSAKLSIFDHRNRLTDIIHLTAPRHGDDIGNAGDGRSDNTFKLYPELKG